MTVDLATQPFNYLFSTLTTHSLAAPFWLSWGEDREVQLIQKRRWTWNLDECDGEKGLPLSGADLQGLLVVYGRGSRPNVQVVLESFCMIYVPEAPKNWQTALRHSI